MSEQELTLFGGLAGAHLPLPIEIGACEPLESFSISIPKTFKSLLLNHAEDPSEYSISSIECQSNYSCKEMPLVFPLSLHVARDVSSEALQYQAHMLQDAVVNMCLTLFHAEVTSGSFPERIRLIYVATSDPLVKEIIRLIDAKKQSISFTGAFPRVKRLHALPEWEYISYCEEDDELPEWDSLSYDEEE